MRKRIFLFDYHTQALDHEVNQPLKVTETIQAAIDKKLSAICLTDHYPLPPGFMDPTKEKDCAMPMTLYENYQKEVDQVITRYGKKIEILNGAEFDWLPNYTGWTNEQIKRWPFDYLIGSVHFVGQISDQFGKRNFLIDYTEDELLKGIASYGGIKPLTSAYYKLVRRMVLSGLFDCVGHLDLIKKYNDGSLFDENAQWYQQSVLETLDVVEESDCVIEVNTAGWDKKCRSAYPSLWILQEAKKRKIEITLGSDAHQPEQIARYFDQAIVLIKQAGYKELVRFVNRKKLKVPID